MKFPSLAFGLCCAAAAIFPLSSEACTNLIAGRKATADGSVMVTYAADSHNLYGMLSHTPAADHPKGAMRKVVEWDTSKPLGEIPQVAHTYNVVGNMNEHQVCIGESTWGGRPELVDTTGNSIIDYGSLIQIALERSKTAREALDVMTDLVDKYGYASSGRIILHHRQRRSLGARTHRQGRREGCRMGCSAHTRQRHIRPRQRTPHPQG